MWTKSISLPARKIQEQDSEGFAHTEYEYISGIPASFLDATRDDEILAAQKGYSADQSVEIMACNYNGASFLIDEENGQVYDIQRTFRKDKGMTMVLTCQRRECHGL